MEEGADGSTENGHVLELGGEPEGEGGNQGGAEAAGRAELGLDGSEATAAVALGGTSVQSGLSAERVHCIVVGGAMIHMSDQEILDGLKGKSSGVEDATDLMQEAVTRRLAIPSGTFKVLSKGLPPRSDNFNFRDSAPQEPADNSLTTE
jgi:hypothetical protein